MSYVLRSNQQGIIHRKKQIYPSRKRGQFYGKKKKNYLDILFHLFYLFIYL